MTLRLTIDGTAYEGWINATVDRGLDDFAHGFDLNYLDKWSDAAGPWPIEGGDLCTVSWGSEVLITGRVERPRKRVTSDAWSLDAAGRSLTGVLVKSSAVHETGYWTGRTATQIASDLCAPYDIRVTANLPDTEKFPRFAIREGETVHDALDRLCKIRAYLPRTLPSGDVELFVSNAPGVERTPVIVLDVDSAIERDWSDDTTKRHSEYHVRATGVGTPEESQAQAVATDSGVDYYCPLVVVGDAPASSEQAALRAQWECNTRSGRGESLVYTFQDPINLAGRVYGPTQRYRVKDTYLGVDAVLMCSHSRLQVGEKGVTCTVSLVHPEAYGQFEFSVKKLSKTKPKKTKRGNL